MTRFVQEPRMGCFSLAFMLAMATPRLASAQPDAVLAKTIDISGSGSGPRMRMGDLNGDGRLDILLVQSTNDNPSYVAMLTAYDGYTGKRLWQVGADSGVGSTDRDEPCQVYDIDNDGSNEVLAAMGGQMNIYKGADGTLKTSFALPDASAHDAIIIANFSKNPVPQDIVVKDRYLQAWALDKDGKLLWTYSGITGHYPWPSDADGDGRDELFIGYNQLDYLGKPKYASPINLDHPDAIWLGDIDGDPANGFEVVYGLSNKPPAQCVSARTGEVLWTNSDVTESSEALLADYRPDLPGLETYGLDRTMANSKDSLFLLDSSGKTLWRETGTSGGGGAAIKPIHNWDGTNAPMVLVFKRGSAQVWDGKNTMVHKLPMDGNAVVGDFGGDSKQEVLMYSRSTANIYGISQLDYDQPRPNPGHALRQPKEYYNYSRYLSGDVDAFDTIPGSTNPRSDAGVAGAGGTSGSGGTNGAGGTTDPGGSVSGGTTATGGTGGTGAGGTGTGGTTTGGGPGGSTAAAGAGAVATGGTRPAGGSTSTGGTIIPVGGTTSTGGAPNPGGTVAGSGGIAATGGGETSGGSVALGGIVDAGGIVGNAGTSGAAITGAGGTDSKGALARAGGCSCRVAGQPARSTGLAGLGLLGLMILLANRAIRRCGCTPRQTWTGSSR